MIKELLPSILGIRITVVHKTLNLVAKDRHLHPQLFLSGGDEYERISTDMAENKFNFR